MFSLIVTVISIALVAALGLATLYYGGSALKRGNTLSTAAMILNQAQQLLGSSDAFEAEFRRKPSGLSELIATRYLEQTPQVGQLAWTMPVLDQVSFLLDAVPSIEICKTINLQGSLGRAAVLRKAYPEMPGQCFGESETQLKAVFKKHSGLNSLDGVLAPAEISAVPLPTSDTDVAWLQRP